MIYRYVIALRSVFRRSVRGNPPRRPSGFRSRVHPMYCSCSGSDFCFQSAAIMPAKVGLYCLRDSGNQTQNELHILQWDLRRPR